VVESIRSCIPFYQDKRVLVTGHTGFKGGWLSLILQELGAEVFGYALNPPTVPNFFSEIQWNSRLHSRIADIRDPRLLRDWVKEAQPEVVFHLAAQPLVRRSYRKPIETFETNVMGTLHLLDAIRDVGSVKAVVNVTTDKCYENMEWDRGYRESDRLGGHDIYSSSKACSELLTTSFRESFFFDRRVALASARAGNVIGGGDWAQDRLLPDCFRRFFNGQVAEIRSPSSVRPWQHVLDVLMGYLTLGEALCKSPRAYEGSWNFGPHGLSDKTVGEVVDHLIGLATSKYNAEWKTRNVSSRHDPHEAKLLRLDCSKAQDQLKWIPAWDIKISIEATLDWYWAWKEEEDMHAFSLMQLANYFKEFSR
jgi:CDP-glucose 4,6-dehydratase